MSNTGEIRLMPTVQQDLEHFFEFQLNEEASWLAAFMPKDQFDKAAYLARYSAFLSDPTINMHTIMINDTIVGSVSKYEMRGEAEITYWIDRDYWGRGIAHTALKNFLKIETMRPIFGRVAFDNIGSQKVLEACGFARIGTDRGFASARQAEIEEFIYKLT